MPTFKVKDLMIHLPGDEAPAPQVGPPPGAAQQCQGGCSLAPSVPVYYAAMGCPLQSCFCSAGWTMTPLAQGADAAGLALLQQHLQQHLAQFHQPPAPQAIEPQTLQQVDALEQKLHDALAELHKRRAALQRPPGGTGTANT
jgi:hypothetical protein